jgi:di/tricarboxylate transporter
MTADAWITLAVLVFVFAAIASERLSLPLALGGGLGFLLVTGVIDQETALSGLGSSAPVTIAALYVLAGAATVSGAISPLVDRLLDARGGDRARLARLGVVSAACSAIVPNTPLVALVAPRVSTWARRTGRSPSTYLMPLSFATILGGVITVIGTSTNLVVSDLLRSSGEDALGIFEITRIGLPVALVGVAVLIVAAPSLLRERTRSAADNSDSDDQRYTVAMRVDDDSHLVGQRVEDAGLRHLTGVFLAGVERRGVDGVTLARPDMLIMAGDTFFFVGDIDNVLDLQELDGVSSAESDHIEGAGDVPGAVLYESVIAASSDLVGSTLKATGFRERYSAAVLAIRRHDDTLPGKLGSVTLRAGDVLLVLGSPTFGAQWRSRGDFSVVASLDAAPPPRRRYAWVVLLAIGAMVALAVSGVLDLLEASLVAATGVIIAGIITPSEARRAINLNVVLTIALSISLGGAVAESGLAAEFASLLDSISGGFGSTGAVLVVLVSTIVLTELLSNNAAAAVMFPVAVTTAIEAGTDPREMAIVVLIGASCSFLSPIGYQTNLMVYSLGGYRFTDFTRLGLPLTLAVLVVTPLAVALT